MKHLFAERIEARQKLQTEVSDTAQRVGTAASVATITLVIVAAVAVLALAVAVKALKETA